MPEFVRPLGPDEAQAIRQLVRSRTVPAGLYQRALIIDWSSEGQTPTEIAHRLPMKWDNIVPSPGYRWSLGRMAGRSGLLSGSSPFRKLARSLGLPTTRFHDLRHTHASLLLKEGIHAKVVSERLGHADVGITLNTITHLVGTRHLLPGLQEEAARKLDQALRTAGGM